jgi:hypothetical protein
MNSWLDEMPIYTWKIKTQRENRMKAQWRTSKNCGITYCIPISLMNINIKALDCTLANQIL